MLSDIGFPHIKNSFCDFSRAQIILWGHECQNISETLCEKFLTVHDWAKLVAILTSMRAYYPISTTTEGNDNSFAHI